MKKIYEINKKIKEIYEELKELEASMETEKSKEIDFNYFKGVVKQNAFKDHILTNANEYIQKNYLYLISSLLMFNNPDEIKHSQIMYISRLIEGFCNKNIDIENIYSHTMIMNGVQISGYIEAIKDYKDVFVVDSLICANIKGKANDQVLEYLSEIYFILGITFNEFQSLLQLANCILNKDKRNINAKNMSRFACYINELFDEKVFYKFEDISTNEIGDIIILGSDINLKYVDLKYSNIKFNEEHLTFEDIDNIEYLGIKERVINLNKYSFRSLKFINCKFDFDGIVSLISTNKNIEFINCIIENIVDIYRIENEYIFPIKVKNANFTNCIFENFGNKREYYSYCHGNNISIIFAEKCIFDNTKFINCNISIPRYSDSSFLQISNSKLNNCVFMKSSIMDKFFIKSANSEINRVLFKECYLYLYNMYSVDGRLLGFTGIFGSSRDRNAENDNNLLYLINSKINNCRFEDCKGIDSDNVRILGHLMLMKNSKEINNEFINCKFDSMKKEEAN